MDETIFMDRALALARRAEGSVAPRPPVGAVVVSPDGEIVGEGFTHRAPGPHAEAAALQAAGERARGSTMFVTLEPCTKSSVSMPCAEQVVRAGIGRVVASLKDPNPDVDGRGFSALREAGIEIDVGPGAETSSCLIEPFAKWITTGQPFVTLKLAASLDGKVAAPDGTSRWITGEEARAEVHELRRRVDAVLVGSGTVIADDPALTFRTPGLEGDQPLRVVLDSSGRTPRTAQIFDGSASTLVITTAGVDVTGSDVAHVAAGEDGVVVRAALDELGRRGICLVLVEAGPTLAGSFVERGAIDRVILYVAPKIIGGDAPGLIASGVKTITDAWRMHIESVTRVGDDIRIDARPELA